MSRSIDDPVVPAGRLEAGLDEIEQALKATGLWSQNAPSAEALASSMPFCHDRLFFHEWLQWVFLPRMRALIANGQRPPMACQIHPMAEHSLAELAVDTRDLEAVIARFDRLAAHWSETAGSTEQTGVSK
ncbi:MAG: YqcC family protein [Halothiobacillaceae bacterium]